MVGIRLFTIQIANIDDIIIGSATPNVLNVDSATPPFIPKSAMMNDGTMVIIK